MKKYKYPIPLYHGSFTVIIADDLVPHFRDVGGAFNAVTDAIVIKDLFNIHIGIKPEARPETIAHEAVHAANMVFEYVGIEPSLDNDEPLAYLVGWFVTKLHNSLDKYNKIEK